jgi:hypothetical protein
MEVAEEQPDEEKDGRCGPVESSQRRDNMLSFTA